MMIEANSAIENAVRAWLETWVIGFNFCPFAKKPYLAGQVEIVLCQQKKRADMLALFAEQLNILANDKNKETVLLVFPYQLLQFYDYLDFLDLAQHLLTDLAYEGQFQLASFHPDYCFEGVELDDVSNFTNRAPYPIIHILRESSLEQALKYVDNPEQIPERNIAFCDERESVEPGFWIKAFSKFKRDL